VLASGVLDVASEQRLNAVYPGTGSRAVAAPARGPAAGTLAARRVRISNQLANWRPGRFPRAHNPAVNWAGGYQRRTWRLWGASSQQTRGLIQMSGACGYAMDSDFGASQPMQVALVQIFQTDLNASSASLRVLASIASSSHTVA
jgi:hypothetical protein